jgi:hypothetical protein
MAEEESEGDEASGGGLIGDDEDEEQEEKDGASSSSSSGDRAAAPTDGGPQQHLQPLSSATASPAALTPPTNASTTTTSTTPHPTHHHHHHRRRAASPPQPAPTYGSFLHAVTLGCLVVAMSFGINILNLLVYLLFRPVSRVAARRIVGGIFQAMWVNVTAYLLPRSELVMTGDMPVDPTRPAIIIANHQVCVCLWWCD